MALSKCITKGKELASIQESNTTEAGAEMDPTLWGGLQNHIDMKLVYEKLPLQAFFILRRVCKSWNAMACERRNFKERIPQPFFVSLPFSWSIPRIVAFNIPSGRWVWKRLWQRPLPLLLPLFDERSVPAFALHGMLYTSHCSRTSSYVIDILTEREYMLPPVRMTEHSWVGMVVDTTVTPRRFKIIRGDLKLGTEIFDSEDNMWTWNASTPLRQKPRHLVTSTCANLNGSVYIRSVAPDIITVYDLAKATWSELQPPQQLPGCRTYDSSLGTWQGKLLTVVESSDSAVVCEHDGETQQWKKFFAMPAPLYKNYYQGGDDVIWSSFYEEYVLIAVAWHYPRAVCLGNMATRRWEVFIQEETVIPLAEAARP